MGLTVLSERVIRAATKSTGTLVLGPMDALTLPYIPIAVIFVYRQDHRPVVSLDRLQHALRRLLEIYPYLAGRMSLREDGNPQISQLDSGMQLLEATEDSRLPGIDFTLNDLPEAGNALLAPFPIESVPSGPVFTIQHTRFACGGVTLGIRALHAMCDGDGFFRIVNSLTEIYRSSAPLISVAPPPFTPNLALSQSEDYLRYSPELYHDDATPASVPRPSGPVQGRFLHLSEESLRAVKELCAGPDGWVSTYEALSAFLFHHIHLARVKTGIELSPTDFLNPINLRQRLELSPQYPYNGLFTAVTTIPPEHLAGDLPAIARHIHALNASIDTDDVEQTLRWMTGQKDKTKIRDRFRYGTGSLMISAWSKFDMYGIGSFDSEPCLVSTPFTQISNLDGLIYFLPVKDKPRDIEVAIALTELTWSALNEDEQFWRRFDGREKRC